MRQAHPSPQRSQVLIVIVRNDRKRRRAHFLPAEAPIVPRDELVPGGSRGVANGASEGGPHAEMRVESAGAGGRVERPQVHVKFPGELIKWQELVLSLVMNDRFSGTLQDDCGNDSSSAIPWPVGLERNRQERGELALSQTDRSTQLAQLVHRCAHDAIGAAAVKRPPASMAGGHVGKSHMRTAEQKISSNSATE